MSGIYIHIPYCKRACSYCNFHFSTNLNTKGQLLEALKNELHMRAGYLGDRPLESLYFGGGTPSLFSADEINSLLNTITSHHQLSPDAEITLEANPDDLTQEYIAALRETPVNRLSIGIQSFYDDALQCMHRVHSAHEGLKAIEIAVSAGFRSLNIDLIYGTPQLTERRWVESLERVAALDIPHLSAYQLTIEPKTILAYRIDRGISATPDDDATADQFGILMDWAEACGYAHYEISNLAKQGHRAVHNTNYWKGQPYLGIGPSAHSFDGRSRSWNVANNVSYIRGIAQGSAQVEQEVLTPAERFNEIVMTGLRTTEGVLRGSIEALGTQYVEHLKCRAAESVVANQLTVDEGGWKLTRDGRFFADRIAAELFII